MKHTLASLPYGTDKLEPYISKETLEYHHGKHLKSYVDNLNALIENDEEYVDTNLIDIIKFAAGPLFNNAAQIWNHEFYFNCLTPKSTKPSEKLLQMIDKDFGSLDSFKAAFNNQALKTFGSGWVWLILNESKLEIYSTQNADTPVAKGQHALLTCDVWEHAYYIDTRNSRPEYLKRFWNVVNWDFVNNNLEKL
jgi:Fe-Mn family superoxide dismutase